MYAGVVGSCSALSVDCGCNSLDSPTQQDISRSG